MLALATSKKPIDTGREEIAGYIDKINGRLKQYGMLLESDKRYPSIVGTIVGEPVSGSWWGHPKGILVYNVLKQLSMQPDVLTAKLLDAKTTFLHRPLWPIFLTVATSHEPWQTSGLSKDEKRLYDAVVRTGQLRTDEYSKISRLSVGVLGKSARELEKRLLVYGEGFHSTLGSHAKRLETWDHWGAGRNYPFNPIEPGTARGRLESVRDGLRTASGTGPTLPWEGSKRSARKEKA